jgi:myo-inositol-1(or 4)-monophosphatase
MADIDIDELLSWVRDAGATARRYFNQAAARRKADNTWVTEADVAIERALVERIAARYPQHGIIGEEQTNTGAGREFLWALDPLDGTASFVAGLPMWGVSLGLLRGGAPYLGAVYLPLLDDCYWAGPSGEAFLNGRAIRVAPPRAWEGEDWISVPSNSHRRFTLDFVGKTRSLGCTAASLCYVARGGGAIGALITRAAIWDIAAGLAILRAAGGVAVGLSGVPLDTTTLLDGRLIPEPALLGAEPHVAGLRAVVRDRRAQPSPNTTDQKPI